ncbi:MAG: hypothetical protein HY738_09440 [Bacteroidia bacterium]|nr:hypothetical protein [Bacteroidia bacterium]
MNQTKKTVKVFLPWMPDNITHRNEMKDILVDAGLEVIPGDDCPQDEQALMLGVKEAVTGADCSIHILTSYYGKTLGFDNTLSIAKFQFNEAKKCVAEKPGFKIFTWYPANIVGEQKEPLQEAFINEIRHGITANIVFTSIASPIQLVDDIRSMMESEEKTHFDVNNTEIFVMFNELDQGEAESIVDMLRDIISVEKLNIIQDWALPFVQQVWKKVGGAATNTPILLIGDENPDVNKGKIFKAPKVVSLIVSGELIPLEIKMQYDKIVETIEK